MAPCQPQMGHFQHLPKSSPVMIVPSAARLDYGQIAEDCACGSTEQLAAFLQQELPYSWRDAYLEMSLRPTDIVRVRYATFEYIYDHYPELQSTPTTCTDTSMEPRLVGVLGRSAPQQSKRDDYRLKGWVGPTEEAFGRRWDKGHFMAHSLGGTVDGSEINVFVQRRSLNRGWSAAGKRYRQMESYCAAHAGTFCFSRPLYVDQTAKPAFVEFGLLKGNRELWIECFDNQ